MENTILGIVLNKNDTTGFATRLTVTSDPYRFVNTDIGDEQHPVDVYSPWSGIEQRDEKSYYIPSFFFKFIEENGKMYLYISSMKKGDFQKHPASGRVIDVEHILFLEKHMAQLLYVMEFLDLKKIQ